MVHPPAAKASRLRRFRQVLAGVAAIISLTAIFFLLLRWRTNTPEQHLNLGNVAQYTESGQSDE
jgi:hypothetical protein